MDRDDPGRATVFEELSLLTQLRRGENSQPIRSPVKPGDPRRAQIVQEIMRLSDTFTQG